jgi:hypothetical protein
MGKKLLGAAAVLAASMSAGLAEAPQSNEDAALASLLNDLGSGEPTPQPTTEVVEGSASIPDAELEAALAPVESLPIHDPSGPIPIPAQPTESIEPAAPVVEQPAAAAPVEKQGKKNKGFKKDGSKAAVSDEDKAKAAKEAADKKAARDKDRAEKKAKREVEAAAKPKVVHYGNDKVRRIKETLGDKLGDLLVLELADAALEGEALAQYQSDVLAMIGKLPIKVKNRAMLLLDYVAGKSSELNNVITTAFRALHADGKLVSGDEGNLHQALLKKPYSAGAARAMGRNTINLFVAMKIVTKGEKQEFAANPASMLRAKVNSQLGLSA